MKRPVWIAASLLAGLALAGCGGDTLSIDPVAQAAENTTQVSTMRMATRGEMTMPGVGTPVSISGQGRFDNASKRGSITLDMSDLASVARGTKLADPSLWRGEEVFDFGKRPILWMRFPFLTQNLPSGKKWIRVDLQLVGDAMGVDFSQLMQGAQGNPAQQLDYLRAVGGDLKTIGDEQVRGVETTHYGTTVDLRKYPKLVPEDQRESVKESIDQLIRLTGESEYPVEVWIDAKQLVRRMAFEQSFKAPGGRMSMKLTVDYFDFGKPVHVTLPSPSQTADLSELIKAAQ